MENNQRVNFTEKAFRAFISGSSLMTFFCSYISIPGAQHVGGVPGHEQ